MPGMRSPRSFASCSAVRDPSRSSGRTPQMEQLEAWRLMSGTGEPVGGVDEAAITVSATQAVEAEPMRMFSWHDWDLEGVTPMVWAKMDSQSPEQAVAETLPQLLAAPEGERAVFFWHFGDTLLERGLDDVVRNGMYTDHERAWVRAYLEGLKAGGVTPDFVVLDYEDGVSYWHIGEAEAARVLADPSLREYLPLEVQAFPVESLSDPQHPQWREAVLAFNRWANGERVEAIRNAVVDQVQAVYGEAIPVSNYADQQTSFAAFDANGWLLETAPDATASGWSSPSLYLDTNGNLHQAAEDPAWSNFVENLNIARSSLNVSDNVAPWVSYASYGPDRDLWSQQLLQLRAAGVDTFLLWNPGSYYTGLEGEAFEAERAFMQAAINEARGMNGVALSDDPYVRVDRDAMRVDTQGFVVEQSDRRWWMTNERFAFEAVLADPQVNEGTDAGPAEAPTEAVPVEQGPRLDQKRAATDHAARVLEQQRAALQAAVEAATAEALRTGSVFSGLRIWDLLRQQRDLEHEALAQAEPRHETPPVTPRQDVPVRPFAMTLSPLSLWMLDDEDSRDAA